MKTMLILRGISGTFGGVHYSRGALDEPSAKKYAMRRGYSSDVLDVSGETGPHSAQTQMALRTFRADKTICSIYGFSGGGYNLRHVLDQLDDEEAARLELIVVLGAPADPPSLFKGPWELVYREDPPAGHMAGPAALLAELDDEETS
jgi:hypothetical protein